MNDNQINELYTAFNQGDVPTVLSRIHPQAEWIVHGFPELPIAGHFHGLEQIVPFFQVLMEQMEITMNDPSIIYRSKTHTNQVLVWGLCASIIHKTKKTYEVPFADAMTFDEQGRIVKYERLMDSVKIALAFQD